jgi:integration host factor subunit beta
MTDATMTKADLVEIVKTATQLEQKVTEEVIETVFDSLIAALRKGERIEIRGFGTFRTRDRRGRQGRNPRTGEKVEVPAKKILFFKPSKDLKDFVNTSSTTKASAASSPETPAQG